MTDSNYYLNLFPWLNPPKKLYLKEVKPKHEDIEFSEESDYIIYKHAANLAGNLSHIKNPIASKGKYLISERPIDDISEALELFTNGMLLKEVETQLIRNAEIELNDTNTEFFRNFLNRKLDHYMEQEGFIQNGRFYWKPEQVTKLDNKFNVKKGLFARTQVFPNQKVFLLADYRTHYYSKLTIWDIIQEILTSPLQSFFKDL